MKTLILASASPRRREILKQVGIDFTVIPSTKEEVITKQEPKDAVMELALQKAEDVAGRADGDCMVIGADTVVAMEGSILGKPEDKDDAARDASHAQRKQTSGVYRCCVHLRGKEACFL